jgi:geranylgeranyl diphosphate synthase type I
MRVAELNGHESENTVASAWQDVLFGIDGIASLALLLNTELARRWQQAPRVLEQACRYALVPAGKAFRPILLLESATAVGGDAEAVLPAAIGAEYGHVASLIHDDIIDGDEMRRGRVSVYRQYGVGEAIVAGDALIFQLFACLAECRDTGIADSRITAALDTVARAGIDLCRGQSMESELGRGGACSVEDYLTMIRLKTGAFFRGACQSGAVLGGGPPDQVSALGAYGDDLGIAFQIHDDLLGYTSDTATMGKAATSDIRNGRLTLPIILAYQLATPADCRLIDQALDTALDQAAHGTAEHNGAGLDEALPTIRAVLERSQTIQACMQVAHNHAEQASRALAVLPPSPSRDTLAHFARLAVARDH